MELTLNLNSRLQPMHRHDLEDALQEILEKNKSGRSNGWRNTTKSTNRRN